MFHENVKIIVSIYTQKNLLSPVVFFLGHPVALDRYILLRKTSYRSSLMTTYMK